MAGFAAWIAAMRFRRVALIAGLFPLPFVSLVSAAIVVFTADLKGWQEAFKDAVFALLVLVLIEFIAGGEQASFWFLGGAALTLGFACVLGALLHKFRSLTLAVQSAVLIVILGVVVFELLTPDPQVFWLTFIENIVGQLEAQGFTGWDDIPLEALAAVMTVAIAISLLMAGLLALLLGFLMSCSLRGESFAAAFQSLRLGYIVGGLAALLGIAALFGLSYAGNMLVIVSIAFVFQGIAVLASLANRKGWKISWWGYVMTPLLLLIFLPVPAATLATGLAAIGFIDNWYSLRPQK